MSNTPTSLGFLPSKQEIGTIMKGKDNKEYIVYETKTGKRWKKHGIDYDNLPKTCYRNVYYPVFETMSYEEETGMEENKIGGKKPFFRTGELWPRNDLNCALSFLCQYMDPRDKKKILYRVFYDIKTNVGCVMEIEMNENNKQNQIIIEIPNKTQYYPVYKIKEWTLNKELIDFEELKIKKNIDDTNDTDNTEFKNYEKSIYCPKYCIKIGGTSILFQRITDEKKYNNIFQICECEELPLKIGDSGTIHLYKNRFGKYYLSIDC